MMKIFRNIGEQSALVHDALQGKRVQIAPRAVVVVSEKEGSRLEGLPYNFRLERTLELHELLENALNDHKRPYASVMPKITSKGKVLFLFDSEGGGYLGQRMWELQIGIQLAKNGYAVHFLADQIPPYAKEWPGHEAVTWERAGESEFSGFDFIVGTPPQNLERALELGKANGIPVVFVCGELVSDTPGRKLSDGRILELNSLYKEAKMVIAPSDAMKERMVASGVKDSNVAVVIPGVNPQLLTAFRGKKVKERPKVTLCARLDFHKQLVPTIRSLILHPLAFDIHVITSDAKKLTSEVGHGNDRHNITAVERVSEEEKAKIFAESDVLVHPSLHEGFGMTVLEALVMGMQVVAPPLLVYKSLFGNDICYYPDDSQLHQALSTALTKATGEDFSKKYREMARKDRSISLERIFRKREIAPPMNTRRILIVGRSLEWGGGELSKVQMAQALIDAGFEAEFGSWQTTSTLVSETTGFKQHIFSSTQQIRSFIEKRRPGFVIVERGMTTQMLPILEEFGIPFAILFQFWTPFFNKVTKILEGDPMVIVNKSRSPMLSKAEFIISNSDYTASVIKKFFGLDSIVVYPAIDKKRLHGKPGPKKRDTILTAVLEDENVGLNFYKELLERLPNRKFVALVFRGPESVKKALLSRYSNLTILDGVDDVAPHFYAARAYLYPIQVDHSYGRSFCEAALTKTPIVASRLGNPPLILPESGKWFDNLDADAWVEEIEKLFTDEGYFEKRSSACQKEARRLPEPDFAPLVSRVRDQLFRPQKVVLTNKGGFMAGTRHFTELARVVESASFETGQSDNLVFYGPPRFQMELVSPSSFCYWASTPLESQIDRELSWLDEAIELTNKGRLAGIIFADPASFELAVLKGCKKAYLLRPPAPYLDGKFAAKPKANHVSLMFSTSPRKNLINQLLAIQRVGNLTVHTSTNLMERIPPEFTSHINFVRWEHLPDDKFFEVISGCSVGLQVSIGESFDFAAFEHLLLGIPCLVGRSAKFAADLPNKYAEVLVVDDIDDANEITLKLKKALEMKSTTRKDIAAWAQKWGEKWNKKVKEEFETIFS